MLGVDTNSLRGRLVLVIVRMVGSLVAIAVVLGGFVWLTNRGSAVAGDDIAASGADFTEELFPTLEPRPQLVPDYTPPPGFPTSELRDLPPDPEPSGGLRTINTIYGISYSVPADWYAGSGAVTSWPDGTDSRYNGIATGGDGYCPLNDNSTVRTAMRRANALPLDEAALTYARTAEAIWAHAGSVRLEGPVSLTTASGEPAVRYTALIDDIPADDECTPTSETFDVVALRGYAGAETVVFVAERKIGVDREFPESVVDDIVSSLRETS